MSDVQREQEDPLETSSAMVMGDYLVYLVGFMVVYWVMQRFWGDYILLTLDDLNPGGSVMAGLAKVWFIFAWAAVGSFVFSMIKQKVWPTYGVGVGIAKSVWVSLNAGIFEEIIYRWLTFFSGMAMLTFLNWITFGLVRWLHLHLFIPVANFLTLHALEPQLYSSHGWVVGAALVSAAAAFRNQHQYLGLIWYVNSWFIGMIMFYLVFNYGLITAIVAHVLYDIIVFVTRVIVNASK